MDTGKKAWDIQYAERIAYLVRQHLAEKLTAAEEKELNSWLTESDEHLELFEKLINEEDVALALQQYVQSERSRELTLLRIKRNIRPVTEKDRLRRLMIFALAAGLVFISVMIYLFFNLLGAA